MILYLQKKKSMDITFQTDKQIPLTTDTGGSNSVSIIGGFVSGVIKSRVSTSSLKSIQQID